jgi:hypothetical protein
VILRVGTEPVKEIFLTLGFSHNLRPDLFSILVCSDHIVALKTPFGKPPRPESSANASPEYDVSAAGLRTTVKRAAIAAPIFRVIVAANDLFLRQLTIPIPEISKAL